MEKIALILATDMATCVNKTKVRNLPELFCSKELSATKMYQSRKRKAITITNRCKKNLLIDKIYQTKISRLNDYKTLIISGCRLQVSGYRLIHCLNP
jgi:hypothetical protein